MKKIHDAKEEIPPQDAIADEIGISVNRLKTALRATQRLLSMDEALTGPRKGSDAGAAIEWVNPNYQFPILFGEFYYCCCR